MWEDLVLLGEVISAAVWSQPHGRLQTDMHGTVREKGRRKRERGALGLQEDSDKMCHVSSGPKDSHKTCQDTKHMAPYAYSLVLCPLYGNQPYAALGGLLLSTRSETLHAGKQTDKTHGFLVAGVPLRAS